jgi:hypothetical protein
MYNLQQSINWANPYILYAPLTPGVAGEPAVSTATLIRDSLLSPPLTWPWNRKEDSSVSTVAGTQDYTVSLTDFGFLEKASLSDGAGNVYEIKDVYNNLPLSMTTTAISGSNGGRSRPTACAVLISTPGTSIKIRMMPVPEAVYTINLTYQVAPVNFTPNVITAAGNASAGNTSYTGTFTPALFVAGQAAMILEFVTHTVNNGTFTIVSCNATTLVVANAAGVSETNPAYAINASWYPIPDSYNDIYNWLFLSEALSVMDDPRSQLYRQRGIAAFLAKSSGLTEMQKNVFIQQWLNYNRETQAVTLQLQQAHQARSV